MRVATAIVTVLTAIGCGEDSVEGTASFRALGFLNEQPGAATRAFGISRDGRYLVGDGISDVSLQAFRWSTASGFQALGFAPGKVQSEALTANQDGSIIAGDANGFRGTAPRAARWSASSGWELLEGDGFTPMQARGISADGSTIVGESEIDGTIDQQAFLWTSTGGSRLLGSLGPGLPSVATGISADGTVVAGIAANEAGEDRAFRWTEATGLVALPVLSGAQACEGQSISADGGTIVGNCDTQDVPEAVLWDERGAVALGFLPGGVGSFLRAVSADGSVGVGEAGDSQGFARAALWTEATGMVDLRELLIEEGLGTQLEGWYLNAADTISSDGQVIAGFGRDPNGGSQAYVVTLPGLSAGSD